MTAYGIDVSQFQKGLDLRAVAGQGYSFAIGRVSFSSTLADPQFAVFKSQASKAGLLFAAYHFLTTADVRAQAANVAAHIGDRRIPVWVDCEPYKASRPTMDTVLGFTRACQANGLTVVGVYLPRSWWAAIGRPSIPSSFGLWNAAYPSSRLDYGSSLYLGDGHKNWDDYGGHRVGMWQFASTCQLDGFAHGVDVDAYRGTRDELAATDWFHDYRAAPPKPPAPKPPTPKPPTPPTPENDVPLTDADAATIWRHRIKVSDDEAMLDQYGYSKHEYAAASLVVDASWRVRALQQRVAALEAALEALAKPAAPGEQDGGQA